MNQQKSYSKHNNISQYYDQLHFKSGQFIGYLAERGMYGRRVSMTDYQVKILVVKGNECFGHALIYYKPSKMQYKFVKVEISDIEVQDYLQELWDDMNDEGIKYIGKYVIKINR